MKIHFCYDCQRAVKSEGGKWQHYTQEVATAMVRKWSEDKTPIIFELCPLCERKNKEAKQT